jgi:hypothetical protein
MATTENTVIIRYDIDPDGNRKKQDELTQSIIENSEAIKQNKAQQKELTKASGDNTEAVKSLQKEELKLKDRGRELNAERREAVKVSKLQSNSLALARKRTAELTKTRDNLNLATKQGRKQFAELTKEIKRNNDFVQDADKEAGNFKSSIGGYEQAITSALGPMGAQITALQQTVTGLKASKVALAANTKVLGLFKKALVSTGIGALVVALGSFITFLTKTQDGLDGVNKFLDQVGAVVDVLIGRFAKFGEVVSFILDREFSMAWDAAGEAVSGVTDEMAGAVEQAGALHDLNIQIEEDESRIALANSERRKQIQELIFLTRDESVSFEERRKALEEANKLENAILKDNLDLQAQKIQSIKDEIAATPENLRNRQQEIDLQAALTDQNDLQSLSLAKQRELLNRLNELENKRRAQAKASLEEQKKIDEIREKNLTEAKLAAEKLAEAEAETQKFILSQEQEAQLERLKGTKEFYNKRSAFAEENFNMEVERLNEERHAILENDEITFLEKQLLLEENNLAHLEIQKEFRDELNQINEESEQKQTDTAEKFAQERNNIFQQGQQVLFSALNQSLIAEDARISRSYDKRQNDLRKALDNGLITQEEYDKKQAQLEKNRAREEYKVALAQFKVNQTEALANIAIDTAQNVIEAYPNPFLIAGALALGAAQALIVRQQPAPAPPSFADGGEVPLKSGTFGGKPHELGGTPIFDGAGKQLAEVEANEKFFVLNERASAFIDGLDNINQMFGGRSLKQPSVKFMREGGQLNVDDNSQVENIVRSTLDSFLKNTNINVQVSDIINGVDTFQNTVNVGIEQS